LVATGGSDQHASVLEYHLRPLASFLGMVTTPTAIFARDTEFLDYQLNSEAIAGRIEQVADQSLDLLGRSSGIALAA
ncbi:partial FMN reductase, partial [Gammaproteobacteria bacterium]